MATFLLSAGKMDGVSSVFVEGALHQVSELRIPSILRSEFIFDDFLLLTFLWKISGCIYVRGPRSREPFSTGSSP